MAETIKKSLDPYESGIHTTAPAHRRLPLEARFVAVSAIRKVERGLTLIHPRTRCIKRHEVHELILTDEMDVAPGGPVNRCHYLGFVEFMASGLLIQGDPLMIDGKSVGTLAGFDECHFPNHYNIVVKGPVGMTGAELGLDPGSPVVFVPWA
ncbi:MAG: DUF6917 domain-containing protein [Burkholderiales bacterium]